MRLSRPFPVGCQYHLRYFHCLAREWGIRMQPTVGSLGLSILLPSPFADNVACHSQGTSTETPKFTLNKSSREQCSSEKAEETAK